MAHRFSLSPDRKANSQLPVGHQMRGPLAFLLYFLSWSWNKSFDALSAACVQFAHRNTSFYPNFLPHSFLRQSPSPLKGLLNMEHQLTNLEIKSLEQSWTGGGKVGEVPISALGGCSDSALLRTETALLLGFPFFKGGALETKNRTFETCVIKCLLAFVQGM